MICFLLDFYFSLDGGDIFLHEDLVELSAIFCFPLVWHLNFNNSSSCSSCCTSAYHNSIMEREQQENADVSSPSPHTISVKRELSDLFGSFNICSLDLDSVLLEVLSDEGKPELLSSLHVCYLVERFIHALNTQFHCHVISFDINDSIFSSPVHRLLRRLLFYHLKNNTDIPV